MQIMESDKFLKQNFREYAFSLEMWLTLHIPCKKNKTFAVIEIFPDLTRKSVTRKNKRVGQRCQHWITHYNAEEIEYYNGTYKLPPV